MYLNADARWNVMANHRLKLSVTCNSSTTLHLTYVVDVEKVNEVFSAQPSGKGISCLVKTIFMNSVKDR